MSKKGAGKRTVSRMVSYRIQVPESDESRVEKLLIAAEKEGIVYKGQWDYSRGMFWWNGFPGEAMRKLRDEIGGEPIVYD
jgi:hypothetical protein